MIVVSVGNILRNPGRPPIKLRTLLLAQHRARKTRKRLDAHFLLGMGIKDSTSLKGLRRNPLTAAIAQARGQG